MKLLVLGTLRNAFTASEKQGGRGSAMCSSKSSRSPTAGHRSLGHNSDDDDDDDDDFSDPEPGYPDKSNEPERPTCIADILPLTVKRLHVRLVRGNRAWEGAGYLATAVANGEFLALSAVRADAAPQARPYP
ncbi:hypothetical protein Purlil1_10993 [Purpureocillium lilacinum]|uniref:Uncharacterized protein n=1 Tax=Purpureocillium lilacinum TaxID=33203 RepID=A0ABR0BLF2_PURLI|nr:hypothetical protein Purlil1_10993 [Purpureocillium lilacinum]